MNGIRTCGSLLYLVCDIASLPLSRVDLHLVSTRKIVNAVLSSQNELTVRKSTFLSSFCSWYLSFRTIFPD